MGILRGRDQHKPSHHRLENLRLHRDGAHGDRSRAGSPAAEPLIGYTEFRTDLPGGRHANVATMRAVVVGLRRDRPAADRRGVEPRAGFLDAVRGLVAGRSPGDRRPRLGEPRQRPLGGGAPAIPIQRRRLAVRHEPGQPRHRTAPRTSRRSTGSASTTPASSSGRTIRSKLGFQAIIDGNSHPFRMDRDGTNKHDLTKDSKEFAYGFSASKDGAPDRLSQELPGLRGRCRRLERPQDRDRPALQLRAQWSADGKHLLFVAGEHYNCHPYVVRADGTGLRKLADRGGYRGVIEFLDVPDFHGGSSDIPAWSADGTAVYYTAKVGANVELFRVGARRRERTPDANRRRFAPLPPDAVIRRPMAGLWIEAEWRPATPRHAARGPLRATPHGPRTGPRGHVAPLATDAREVTCRVPDARPQSRAHLMGMSYRMKPRTSPTFLWVWHSAHLFMTTGTTVAASSRRSFPSPTTRSK